MSSGRGVVSGSQGRFTAPTEKRLLDSFTSKQFVIFSNRQSYSDDMFLLELRDECVTCCLEFGLCVPLVWPVWQDDGDGMKNMCLYHSVISDVRCWCFHLILIKPSPNFCPTVGYIKDWKPLLGMKWCFVYLLQVCPPLQSSGAKAFTLFSVQSCTEYRALLNCSSSKLGFAFKVFQRSGFVLFLFVALLTNGTNEPHQLC